MAFSHWKTSDKHVARSYSNRRPVIGWDKFYLPSKETISFVKRDMNINGGIWINSRKFLQNMNIY